MLQRHGRLHFPKSLGLMLSCQLANPIVVSAKLTGVNPTPSGLFLPALPIDPQACIGNSSVPDPSDSRKKRSS